MRLFVKHQISNRRRRPGLFMKFHEPMKARKELQTSMERMDQKRGLV